MSDAVHHQLLEQFKKAAVGAAATVEIVPATAEAVNTALVKASGSGPVLLSEPDAIDPALLAVFRMKPLVITRPTNEQFSTVPVGITDAFCAIASTGSVCVSMSPGLTSPVSMLTRKHIVLVDGATILPRPSVLFSDEQREGKGRHRSFTYITGPSATADMGPLVRGVHGPGALHIIVLEQPNDRC
jgi:L-lactate dehydrogenase complex protein LldG